MDTLITNKEIGDPDCFPVLELDAVRVLNFERKHITERYVSWLNDPEVVKFSEQRHTKHTLASCTQYFETIKKTSNYFLAIETIEQDIGHIGNIGVLLDHHNSTAEMSIIVGEKKVWRTGMASIAWCLVLKYLVVNQGVRKVTAGTMAINEPMLQMMRRSGMRIEATRKKHFIWCEQEVDLIQSAIFCQDIASTNF